MTKIITDKEISKIKDKKIILVGGCFDVIHPAHVKFLNESKKLGNSLVVFLESDANIKKIKGEKRPINKLHIRAENLAKLLIADTIILLDIPGSSDYYYNLVKRVHPAIIAITKGDPLTDTKKEQAKLVGGKVVVVMERDTKHSTTTLIEK